MNMRTITCWAVYDPMWKHIVTTRKFKKNFRGKLEKGCVIVKMSGHYFPPKVKP